MDYRVLAVDIGGSKIRIKNVYNPEPGNHVVEEVLEEPVPSTAEELVDKISGFVDGDNDMISIACAGVIKHHNQVVVSPNCHMLDGVWLGSRVKEATKSQKIMVVNDLDAAGSGLALWLRPFGYLDKEEKEADSNLLVNWGSGLAHRLVTGDRVFPSEGGHQTIDMGKSAPICGCGKRGHAEAYLSGKSIANLVKNRAKNVEDPMPDGMNPWHYLDVCLIEKRYWAWQLAEEGIVKPLAIWLANLLTCYMPKELFIRGTFGYKTFPIIEQKVREEMKKHLIIETLADLPIKPAPKEDVYLGLWHLSLHHSGDR